MHDGVTVVGLEAGASCVEMVHCKFGTVGG